MTAPSASTAPTVRARLLRSGWFHWCQQTPRPMRKAASWRIICTMEKTFVRIAVACTESGSRPTFRTLVKLKLCPVFGMSMRMERMPVAVGA